MIFLLFGLLHAILEIRKTARQKREEVSLSDIINTDKNPTYFIDNDSDIPAIARICHALSNENRVWLLRNILRFPKSISALAEELGLPVSNVSRYADALADAGLINITYQPGKKGHTKFCNLQVLSCSFSMDALAGNNTDESAYTVEMPVGMFTRCDISAPCGMVNDREYIETADNPKVFFSPRRTEAECLWFDHGFIGYDFPLPAYPPQSFSELSFTMELCSETTNYNNNWPSDITVLVNGSELMTFTSPGDFGGTRGKYTPAFWPTYCTQFGLLKKVTVNGRGVFLDNTFLHDKITFSDLRLYERNSVQLDIGVKETASHRGGLNLFGAGFGDYPQAIVMTLSE